MQNVLVVEEEVLRSLSTNTTVQKYFATNKGSEFSFT